MEQKITRTVTITEEDAIRAGRSEYGKRQIKIDPAILTMQQRQILIDSPENLTDANSKNRPAGSTYSDDWDDRPALSGEETDEQIIDLILGWRENCHRREHERALKQKNEELAKQAEYLAEYEAKCANPEKWLGTHRLGRRPEIDEPQPPYHLSSEQAKIIIALPASQAARAEAEKMIAQEIAENIEHYINRCADAEQWIDKDGDVSHPDEGWLTTEEKNMVLTLPASIAAKAEAGKIVARKMADLAAADMRRENQISAWVQQYGTPNQQARHAAKVLPDNEVIDAIRAEAFAPLADFPRYEKLEAGDLDHENCYGTIGFLVDDATEISAEQWDVMAKIRALIPGATITPRVHTAECERCEATEARYSLHVSVVVGELTLTREYAL